MEETENNYIRILSHKKIKIKDEILDILHLEDVALAKKIENSYKILSGKYTGKFIVELNPNFEKEDFVASPLTLVEKNLITNSNPTDTSKITLENYLHKCPDYDYFIANEINGQVFLREVLQNEEIKEAFKISAPPSVSEKLSDLITQSTLNRTNSFKIDKETMTKILGKSDSLHKQSETKQIKSFADYNINEKFKLLTQKIIGLDDEIKIVLANIVKNISLSYSPLPPDKVRELKSTLMILGASGTGKTFLIKSIADLFDVPIILTDATRYTPASYQGANVEDILVDLYLASGEDKEVFEHGIIFIDEFDKMCKNFNIQSDENKYMMLPEIFRERTQGQHLKEMLQNEFLSIVQGTVINKKIRDGFIEKNVSLDTSKITFIFAGAFEEIIKRENISTNDLIEYGMIPQLAKRIHSLIKTKLPTKEDLRNALTKGEYSYVKLFEEYLGIYNIKLEVNEDFYDYIVERAYELESGYRGLSIALTEYLNKHLYDIFSSKQDVVKLQIQ